MNSLRTLLLACAALSAHGAAVYQFSGTYRDSVSGEIAGPVTFELTVPVPVTATTDFNPGPQLTCSDCQHVKFYEQGTFALNHVTVGYGLPNLSEYYFYFAPQSFTQPGTYDSELLDGVNDAILTTRITGGPDDPKVPEPSTAVLMLAGLGLCAVRLRRRS